MELALWDLKGKALGAPGTSLGGKVRDGVSLNGFVRRSNAAQMAKEVDAVLATRAYPVIKMKIGVDPAEDIRQIGPSPRRSAIAR